MSDRPLTARDRLKWLLKTYADASTEYNPQPPSDTAGNNILPGNWRYYQELDTWYRRMPQPQRTHLHQRYIHPHARPNLQRHTARITIEKSGRVRGLPPNTELANPFRVVTNKPTGSSPFSGHIAIARWNTSVNTRLAEDAVDWLLTHMHQGDTSQICLPRDLTGATPEHVPATPVAIPCLTASVSYATLTLNQGVQYAQKPPHQAASPVQRETR